MAPLTSPWAHFHPVRGSQYASEAFRRQLEGIGAKLSMSRKGDCWDNAVAESFFSTLEHELVYRTAFESPSDTIFAIDGWIEVFYNRVCWHSTLNYLSPEAFERRQRF